MIICYYYRIHSGSQIDCSCSILNRSRIPRYGVICCRTCKINKQRSILCIVTAYVCRYYIIYNRIFIYSTRGKPKSSFLYIYCFGNIITSSTFSLFYNLGMEGIWSCRKTRMVDNIITNPLCWRTSIFHFLRDCCMGRY